MLALALLTVALGTIDDRTSPTLALHLRVEQDGGLSSSALLEATDQVRRIWKVAGVTVTVGRHDDAAPPGAASVRLRIVPTEDHRRGERTTLAWVIADDDGGLMPTVFVSRSGVLEVVSAVASAGRPALLPREHLDRLIARAIGRAVAHELGHYLLQTPQHVAKGLMRPHYLPRELIAPWLGPFQIPASERGALAREVIRLSEAERVAR